MSIEKQIEALLAKAEPLRCLPEDEPAKAHLGVLVDQINALRAQQADPVRSPGADIPEPDPEAPHSEVKRGPGRPPKAREVI